MTSDEKTNFSGAIKMITQTYPTAHIARKQCTTCPHRSRESYSDSMNLERIELAGQVVKEIDIPQTCHKSAFNLTPSQCVGAAKIQGYWHGHEVEVLPKTRTIKF